MVVSTTVEATGRKACRSTQVPAIRKPLKPRPYWMLATQWVLSCQKCAGSDHDQQRYPIASE